MWKYYDPADFCDRGNNRNKNVHLLPSYEEVP